MTLCCVYDVFFFKDTATTEIYTLSLHDALPIYGLPAPEILCQFFRAAAAGDADGVRGDARGDGPNLREDRKSTRLNSSHANISYAVFCLKKNNPIPSYPSSSTSRAIFLISPPLL